MLQETATTVAVERSSQRDPLSETEVRALLAGLATVKIAKGKAIDVRSAKETGPDDLRGPTGNFRAPMIVRGDTLLVGFNEAALRALM